MAFGDYAAALEMRQVIQSLVSQEIDKQRPRYQMAEVVSIDRPRRRCSVKYPGEPLAVNVNMGSLQPAVVGQVVRIEGMLGDKYVSDVMGQTYNVLEERVNLLENSPVRGPNFLPNPGFEQGFTNWSDYWGPKKYNIETNLAHVYSGVKAVRFDYTASGESSVLQSGQYPCKPGVPIAFSYRIKATEGIEEKLVVVSASTYPNATFFGTGNVETTVTVQQPAFSTYAMRTAVFVPPAGHYYLSVAFRVTATKAGSLWFDDISGNILGAQEPDPEPWVTVPISNTTNFEAYTTGVPTQVRKIGGGMVNMRGDLRIKVAAIVDGSGYTSANQILTLPSGYYPPDRSGPDPVFVCQGSSASRWAMRVTPAGAVYAHRYGPTASVANAWLPFDVCWSIV